MYAGFNLSSTWESKEYQIIGESLGDIHKKQIESVLEKFTIGNGVLEGNRIQNNWFPLIKADVFISHSHSDKKKALSLAGWLKKEFGIVSFVDSMVWGYADDLLKIIDTRYCLRPDGQFYDYATRNLSTSHVHIMLSTALAMLMAKTECLFFLNPTSISTSETINKIKSPWIYLEIGISALLRREEPERTVSKRTKAFGAILENLEIEYQLDSKHLLNLDLNDLITWNKNYEKRPLHSSLHPLDVLYEYISNRQIKS